MLDCMLISFTVVIISMCICTSNYHVAHLNIYKCYLKIKFLEIKNRTAEIFHEAKFLKDSDSNALILY